MLRESAPNNTNFKSKTYLSKFNISQNKHRNGRLSPMAEEQTKRYKIKLKQTGNIARVVIPIEILAATKLADQDPLIVFVNEKGNIELEPEEKKEGAAKCMVCNKLAAKHKCINCGRLACSNCFWELGGLCRKCVKTK